VKKQALIIAAVLAFWTLVTPSAIAVTQKLSLAGFSKAQTDLSQTQIVKIKSLIQNESSLSTAKCTGLIGTKSSAKDLLLARKRAEVTCAHIRRLQPDVQVSSATKKSSVKSQVGTVLIEYSRKPTPTETAPAQQADAYEFAKLPLEACALRETSNFSGAGSKGFPMRSGISTLGEVKISIIPVDFDNAIGVGDPGSMFVDDLGLISDWAKTFSRGKMSYSPSLASSTWLRAPRGADWYTCAECGKGTTAQKQSREAALQELINLADPKVDFKDVDFVYFVFPHKAEAMFGTTIYARESMVQTREGQVRIHAYGEMAGAFMSESQSNRSKIWDHLIHELLHFQGFIGHGPLNGSQLNILTNQWGAAQSVTAWEGFMAGWFNENELLCLDLVKLKQEALVSLSSVDAFGAKPAAVLIKISEEELLVVERRSDGPFSSFPNRDFAAETGFTAYRLNVNGESFRDDRDVAGTEARNFWAYIRENGSILLGQGVDYKSLRIRVLDSNQLKLFTN
jgi:hypothetical protein